MTHLSYLLECLRGNHLDEGMGSARKLTPDAIKSLKPGAWVIVYHATHVSNDRLRGPQNMVFGLDAVAKHSRQYNQDRHGGLYVAPTLKDADKFGRLVFEIAVRTNNLHGTDWGGKINTRGPEAKELASKYPNSFRPGLSDTFGSHNYEPQALLVGMVNSKQILSVHYNGKRYSPAEFIKEFANNLARGSETGMNTTSTRITVDQYVGYLAKSFNKGQDAIIKAIRRASLQGDDQLMDMLASGRTGLKPTAARAMFDKIRAKGW